MDKPKPVVGHHTSWGLATSRYKTEPYKLTPGSTDTMCVRVREKIDIFGVGCDVVDMEGVFIVRRDHACPVNGSDRAEWGKSCIKTEFRSLELYGESPLFGTVRVHLAPEYSSHGEVGPAEDGSLAASCVAHCFPSVELPELNLKLNTGGNPIDLASKVVQVPPVGDVARSENSAPLLDDTGKVIGEIISSDIEVGEIICSFPLGNTGPGGGFHDSHTHDTASGPGFYAGRLSQGAIEHHGGTPETHHHSATDRPQDASLQQVTTLLNRLGQELSQLVNELKKQGK